MDIQIKQLLTSTTSQNVCTCWTTCNKNSHCTVRYFNSDKESTKFYDHSVHYF